MFENLVLHALFAASEPWQERIVKSENTVEVVPLRPGLVWPPMKSIRVSLLRYVTMLSVHSRFEYRI